MRTRQNSDLPSIFEPDSSSCLVFDIDLFLTWDGGYNLLFILLEDITESGYNGIILLAYQKKPISFKIKFVIECILSIFLKKFSPRSKYYNNLRRILQVYGLGNTCPISYNTYPTEVLNRLKLLPLCIDKVKLLSHSPQAVSSCTNIFYLPDLQHILYPKLFTSAEIIRRNKDINDAIASHSEFLLFCNYTKELLYQYFDLPADLSVNVLPMGPKLPPNLKFRDSIRLQSSYFKANFAKLSTHIRSSPNIPLFLCPNQFWKHKRHDILFEAIRILSRISTDFHVICTGTMYEPRFPDYISHLKSQYCDLIDSKYLSVLNFLPEKIFKSLLRQSDCMLQTSDSEGAPGGSVYHFAYQYQKSIICADYNFNHSVREYPLSYFYSPQNPESLADRMHVFISRMKQENYTNIPPSYFMSARDVRLSALKSIIS